VRDAVVPLLVPMFPPGGALPVKVTLCAGAGAKVQVTVPPAAMSTVLGENVLDAVAATDAVEGNEAVTVTVTAVDCTPSDVALIWADPALTPVAVTIGPEVDESETLDASEVDQVTVRARSLPCASFGCAEKLTVPPTFTDCAVAGDIATLATGAAGAGGGAPPSTAAMLQSVDTVAKYS
jgi:hypothetical protein